MNRSRMILLKKKVRKSRKKLGDNDTNKQKTRSKNQLKNIRKRKRVTKSIKNIKSIKKIINMDLKIVINDL